MRLRFHPIVLAILALLWCAADAAPQTTPADAAVVICNPNPCGSGIIVASDDNNSYGLSAGHCFIGKIGGQFEVIAGDGHRAAATLIGHDKKRDLALFKTTRDATVAAAPVARLDQIEPHTPATIVSFPGTQGPKLDTVVSMTHAGTVSGRKMNAVTTTIPIEPGSSGGGLVANGYTIGIITRSNHVDGDGRCAYAVTNADLCQFLNDCGPNGCWRPQPNVELTRRDAPTPTPLPTSSPMDEMLRYMTRDRGSPYWRAGSDPRLVMEDHSHTETLLLIVVAGVIAAVVMSKRRDH